MFKAEFSIIHRGCLVNELSRNFPEICFICPGGFILGSSVEEIIVLDKPKEGEVQAVLDYLKTSYKVKTVKLLERDANKAFISFECNTLPEKFCSGIVSGNRCFRIGMEIQHGGLEIWRVGCAERQHAEHLLEELKEVGELKHSLISEVSWNELLA